MQYNSIDHFLREHEADIVAIVEAVQRGVGGHYARLTPEELHANAVNDARYIVRTWRLGLADRVAEDIALNADQAGIDLNDLIRLVDDLAAAFTPFIEAQLAEQPDLRADLLRRMRHTSSSYRTDILAACLDKTLRQMQRSR